METKKNTSFVCPRPLFRTQHRIIKKMRVKKNFKKFSNVFKKKEKSFGYCNISLNFESVTYIQCNEWRRMLGIIFTWKRNNNLNIIISCPPIKSRIVIQWKHNVYMQERNMKMTTVAVRTIRATYATPGHPHFIGKEKVHSIQRFPQKLRCGYNSRAVAIFTKNLFSNSIPRAKKWTHPDVEKCENKTWD